MRRQNGKFPGTRISKEIMKTKKRKIHEQNYTSVWWFVTTRFSAPGRVFPFPDVKQKKKKRKSLNRFPGNRVFFENPSARNNVVPADSISKRFTRTKKKPAARSKVLKIGVVFKTSRCARRARDENTRSSRPGRTTTTTTTTGGGSWVGFRRDTEKVTTNTVFHGYVFKTARRHVFIIKNK